MARRESGALAGRSLGRGLAAWLALGVAAAVLAACEYPRRNQELASLNTSQGYRWNALEGGELDDTLLVVTASGGGTRATALTLSTLRGLD